MTRPQDDRTEPQRDPHLLAALRHAPDHALTPPSHVTQAILAAAEQVHRAPAPAAAAPAPVRVAPVRHQTFAERLQALLAPRWAGSVAAGLVAALVVGLWYDEELPAPVNNDRVATQSRRESAPASAATATPGSSPAVATTAAQQPPAVPARTALPGPSATAGRGVTADDPAAKASRPDAAPRVAEAPSPAPAIPAAPPAAAPPAPAAPAAVARDESLAEATAPKAADALRRAPSAAAAPARSAATLGGSAPAVDTSRLAAAPLAGASGVAAASPALTMLRRARADAESRSAIWTWQTEPAVTARSFDAEAQEWLQRLVYAARGRWLDVAERSDGGPAAELRWWRNDEAVALLRIEAEGLRWTEPSGRIRYAPMTADELARLRLP